jgi:hypothetical protein
MKEIDFLLIKLFNFRYEKQSCVRKQEYAKAMSFRDSEKHYESRIYKILTGNESPEITEVYSRVNEPIVPYTINSYCIKEYNISYIGDDSGVLLNQLKRQVKLKCLGI